MIVKEWLDKEENSNSEWNSIVQTLSLIHI